MWKAVSVCPQKSVCLKHLLKMSLQRLFLKKKNLTDIEHWRSRVPVENVLSDIYDGNVWKELAVCSWSVRYSLSIRLNIDWLKIYKHTMGLMYLVIENLP